MSFTEVKKQLEQRNLSCDCIAWYPWRHQTKSLHTQKLGFDSCGIFYIGGDVEVKMNWGVNGIPKLAAVADTLSEVEDTKGNTLDAYG